MLVAVVAVLARKGKDYQYQASDASLICFNKRMVHLLPPPAADPNATQQISWGDSELEFWLRAQANMMTRVPHLQPPGRQQPFRLLDVGCGVARIILKFGWLFDEVTCLEADAKRIATARQNVLDEARSGLDPRLANLPSKVRYVQKGFEDFVGGAPGSFDVITCSQVVQHIPTTLPALWLRSMHRLLRKGGVLAISTTWTHEPRGRLTLEGMQNAPRTTAAIFDSYATSRSKGRLAVRWWGEAEFGKALRAAGLFVIEHAPYMWFDGTTPTSQYAIATNGCHGARGSPPADPFVASVVVSKSERLLLSTEWDCPPIRHRKNADDEPLGGSVAAHVPKPSGWPHRLNEPQHIPKPSGWPHRLSVEPQRQVRSPKQKSSRWWFWFW